MLYREIIAVCSQIHTKNTNTLCGQNVEFVSVKLVVHIVTTGLNRVELVQRTLYGSLLCERSRVRVFSLYQLPRQIFHSLSQSLGRKFGYCFKICHAIFILLASSFTMQFSSLVF